MASFEQGDVVKVPFPYTNRSTRTYRPALVVSTGGIEDRHGLLWVAMIIKPDTPTLNHITGLRNMFGTGTKSWI